MGTKYRKDLSASEFKVVKLFKHLFLKWGWTRKPFFYSEEDEGIAPRISVSTCYLKAKIPYWYLAGSGWQFNNYKEVEADYYLVPVVDFRRICRNMVNDDGSQMIKEWKLVETLNRFSLIGHTSQEQFKWSFEGKMYYALEMARMSETGNIGKLPEEIRNK